MDKQAFLDSLREALKGLPKDEIAERLSFYEEMIDDRTEDGLTEEEAVAGLGPVEEIAAQITSEIPLTKLVKEKLKPGRKLQAWEIVLLALGAPLWLSLLIAAAAVLFSVYVVIWALIVSAWAVAASFAVSALGAAAAGIAFFCRAEATQGLVMLGSGFVLAGLAIFLFFGCRAATKGAWLLTKKIARGVKRLFLRKERAE